MRDGGAEVMMAFLTIDFVAEPLKSVRDCCKNIGKHFVEFVQSHQGRFYDHVQRRFRSDIAH